MIIDGFLLALFAVGFFTLWYKVSLKLPELIAIPDPVITTRLREDSAKWRMRLIHFRSLLKDQRYKESFRNFFGKILYRIHIVLLRIDNGIVSLLKRTKANGGVMSGKAIGEESPPSLPLPLFDDDKI